jgi:hypothetical protein
MARRIGFLMSTTATFTKKALGDFGLAQVVFDVAVLDSYLQKGVEVKRTRTVGRIKSSSWSLDFGLAPDEKTIHVSLINLQQKLPESERAHWLSHADGSHFSENFLKMQSSHACIDDGDLRAWGQAEEESLFD